MLAAFAAAVRRRPAVRAWRSGSGRGPSRARGGRSVDGARRRAEPPRRLVPARRRPAGGPAADDPRLRRRRGRRGRQRGDRARRGRLATDWRGDETLDPRRTLLSELHDGTLAEYVAVPPRNLVPKPAGLSWDQAACLSDGLADGLPDAVRQRRAAPGATVLVQGAGGGRRHRAGPARRRRGLPGLGDHAATRPRARGPWRSAPTGAFASGERLPERVDAVMETRRRSDLVALDQLAQARRHGRHLRRHLGRRPGQGRADRRSSSPAARRRLDDGHPRRAGAAGAVRAQRGHRAGRRPVLPLADAREGFARMVDGEVFGKVVFTV